MPNPLKFITTTDTDTLQNDLAASGTVTVPGGTTLAGSEFKQWTTDVTVSSPGSSMIVFVENNKDPGKRWVVTLQKQFNRTGFVPSIPATSPYSLIPTAYRISSTTVRLEVRTNNPYSVPMNLEATSDVFTFSIRSFKEPF